MLNIIYIMLNIMGDDKNKSIINNMFLNNKKLQKKFDRLKIKNFKKKLKDKDDS